MGEKVTDFKPNICSEIEQNFKNRGRLYNKHQKFICRGFYSELCPYNFNIITLYNYYIYEQQKYYNYNYSENIVPIIELKYFTRKNCLFSEESVVLCRKVQLNINITNKCHVLFVFDKMAIEFSYFV